MTRTHVTTASIQGFRSLEFNLPKALLEQIIAQFDAMESVSLLAEHTSAIPDAQGVYQLFYGGRLVYVGKTDGEAGLRHRLSRHASTIKSRHNLTVAEVEFKAVQVLVFSAMDLETALIMHYRKEKKKPDWNGSGFGNNDPGRERDTTKVKPTGFDGQFPINIDVEIDVQWDAGATAFGVLSALKLAVPYRIRHLRSDQGKAELKAAQPNPTTQPTSARRVIESVCASLPPGWQGTRLAGRIILYREAKDDYPSAEIIARSPDSRS